MTSHFPSPSEFKALLPLGVKTATFIEESRHALKQLIQNKNRKLTFVVGPCSVHSAEGILEYAKKLKNLSERIKDQCFIVMRAYMEKSRTKGGWKGFVYDPFLDGTNNLAAGILMTREILLELAELQIPLAAEIVDPTVFSYYEDLITWGFIGARTASSQVHRQFVSNLSFPVGFKNSLDGDVVVALQSIETARHKHVFLHPDPNGRLVPTHSQGNHFTHLVLRGSKQKPNYHLIDDILKEQRSHEIHSRILVDCSHGNSQKIPEKQLPAFHYTLDRFLQGNHNILGMMLESYTKWGNQKTSEDPALSITDPCLDFDTTEELLLSAAEKLSEHQAQQLFLDS